MGRDSSVGIANRYGLDGTGIEFRWCRHFSAPVQTGPGAQPDSYAMGNGSFSGVKRPGRSLDHSTHLVPTLKKELSYSSTPPLGLRGLFYGELHLYLYIQCVPGGMDKTSGECSLG